MRVKYYLTLLATLTLTANVSADSFIYRNGTITDVDIKNDTFSVVIGVSGKTRTYTFPEKFNYLHNGTVLHDKSLVRPGQPVTLKFRRGSAGYPSPDYYSRSGDRVIKGKVVRMDKSGRIGSLRLERSNKIVPFRLADKLTVREFPRVGDDVVFTYILNDVKVGME
jgi:archaellum component FlaF (FlaF/FlaG flagellin family)